MKSKTDPNTAASTSLWWLGLCYSMVFSATNSWLRLQACQRVLSISCHIKESAASNDTNIGHLVQSSCSIPWKILNFSCFKVSDEIAADHCILALCWFTVDHCTMFFPLFHLECATWSWSSCKRHTLAQGMCVGSGPEYVWPCTKLALAEMGWFEKCL